MNWPKFTSTNRELEQALNRLVELVRSTRAPTVSAGKGLRASVNGEDSLVLEVAPDDRTTYKGRFVAQFVYDTQRLYLLEGRVAPQAGSDGFVRPAMPTLNATRLDGGEDVEADARQVPYWEAAEMRAGVPYEIVVRPKDLGDFECVLMEKGEELPDGAEWGLVVAELQMKQIGEDGKLIAEYLHLRWLSDIPAPAVLPPFWPVLGTVTDEDGEVVSYHVTVTHGVVREWLATAGNNAYAHAYWRADNRLDGSRPRKFTITDGEAVFVEVKEMPVGHIGNPSPGPGETEDNAAKIVVADKLTKSLNYINLSPTAQSAVHYYKLAEFDMVGGKPTLTIVRGGSHIDKTSGLTIDMILENCNGDPYGSPPTRGAELRRERFASGVLAAVGESTTEVPVTPNVHYTQVQDCT